MLEFFGKLGGFFTGVVASGAVVWILGFAISAVIGFFIILFRRPRES